MRRSLHALSVLSVSSLYLGACAGDSPGDDDTSSTSTSAGDGESGETGEAAIPLADEYRWAFGGGRLCLPAQAHTGAVGEVPDDVPSIPIRFQFCRYRCVSEIAGMRVTDQWLGCTGQGCEYTLVPTLMLEPISNEVDCDERDLENPPEEECVWEDFDYDLRPQYTSDMEWPEREYGFIVPYLTFAQADSYREMRDGGATLLDALDAVIGNQVIPDRETTFTTAAANPAVTHDDLTEADCIDIPLPENPSMP